MKHEKLPAMAHRGILRAVGGLLTVTLLLSAVGCDKQQTPIVQTVTVAPNTTPITTSQSGPQPAVLDKQINQQAEVGCKDDDADGACDIQFTVTVIQQGAPCESPTNPLKPDEQTLRFDLDVSSKLDKFRWQGIEYALNLQNWGVIDKEGILHSDLVRNYSCGDGDAAISDAIIPGTHTKTEVVVTAPKDAAFLRLNNPGMGGWKWAIP
jgi:hypothetical protein